MGNTTSTSQSKTPNTLAEVIDFIATNYILTQSFQDMKNLSDINYCDNLVILTSDIIANNLNQEQVEFLAQRLKSGIEVNEMTKDRIIYFPKDKLPNLDVKNTTTKRRLCIGIAKFYIRIAHLFAAIVMTINPTYTYKNEFGETKSLGLLEKDKLPKGAVTTLQEINVCSRRINALINNHDYDVSSSTEVGIKPDFCAFNYDAKTNGDKKLGSEPGIPELQHLYYDIYNYDQGGFGGRMKVEDNMSPEMQEQYKQDLLTFYKAFTGDDKIPLVEKMGENGEIEKVPAITKFSQIPLRSYHRGEGCRPGGIFTQEKRGNLKNKLFYEYASHIKNMLEKSETNQNKLMQILDELFVVRINSETGKKQIVINPKLNDSKLNILIAETRKLIIDLYISCEEDFIKGIQIFEAIVDNQILQTTVNQISQLQKQVDQTSASACANV